MRRRWRRRVALAGCVLLVGFLLLTARLFVWPSAGAPDRFDAVVVLSGDRGERLGEAQRLVAESDGATLVVDGKPDTRAARELCSAPPSPEVVCLSPRPDSTRTEARASGALAAQRGWDRVVVVTSRWHVSRARVLFERCHRASVSMVAVAPDLPARLVVRSVLREWGAYLNALALDRTC